MRFWGGKFMDEKKLREVYETIQIEDGVYRNQDNVCEYADRGLVL